MTTIATHPTPAMTHLAQRLMDPKLEDCLRFIILARGVDECDVEDVIAETRAQALVSRTLPEDEKGWKRYVHSIARHLAARHAAAKARVEEVPYDHESAEIPGVEQPSASAREELEKLTKDIEAPD